MGGWPVRVVLPVPILNTHVDIHGGASMCSVGLAVTVMRVLEGRAYLKNVAEAEDMMID